MMDFSKYKLDFFLRLSEFCQKEKKDFLELLGLRADTEIYQLANTLSARFLKNLRPDDQFYEHFAANLASFLNVNVIFYNAQARPLAERIVDTDNETLVCNLDVNGGATLKLCPTNRVTTGKKVPREHQLNACENDNDVDFGAFLGTKENDSDTNSKGGSDDDGWSEDDNDEYHPKQMIEKSYCDDEPLDQPSTSQQTKRNYNEEEGLCNKRKKQNLFQNDEDAFSDALQSISFDRKIIEQHLSPEKHEDTGAIREFKKTTADIQDRYRGWITKITKANNEAIKLMKQHSASFDTLLTQQKKMTEVADKNMRLLTSMDEKVLHGFVKCKAACHEHCLTAINKKVKRSRGRASKN